MWSFIIKEFRKTDEDEIGKGALISSAVAVVLENKMQRDWREPLALERVKERR